eukprot:210096-Amphidinium_carterae.2
MQRVYDPQPKRLTPQSSNIAQTLRHTAVNPKLLQQNNKTTTMRPEVGLSGDLGSISLCAPILADLGKLHVAVHGCYSLPRKGSTTTMPAT